MFTPMRFIPYAHPHPMSHLIQQYGEAGGLPLAGLCGALQGHQPRAEPRQVRLQLTVVVARGRKGAGRGW